LGNIDMNALSLCNRGSMASTSRPNVYSAAQSVLGFARMASAPRRARPASIPRLLFTDRPQIVAAAAAELNKAPPTPIQLTDSALAHFNKLKAERGEEKTVLRVGVKSGGCRQASRVFSSICIFCRDWGPNQFIVIEHRIRGQLRFSSAFLEQLRHFMPYLAFSFFLLQRYVLYHGLYQEPRRIAPR
jgi:hypothetical protein